MESPVGSLHHKGGYPFRGGLWLLLVKGCKAQARREDEPPLAAFDPSLLPAIDTLSVEPLAETRRLPALRVTPRAVDRRSISSLCCGEDLRARPRNTHQTFTHDIFQMAGNAADIARSLRLTQRHARRA